MDVSEMSVGGSSETGNESKGGQLDPQLLLASLLEEKCRLSTKDTNCGQQLFKELTAHLCNLGILTQDSTSDEYMDLRLQQRKMLSDIILKKSEDFPVLPIYDVRELLELGRPQNSRYKNEFQELDKLGKGGFGSVLKAKHILDGSEYAVKKIRLRSSSKKIKLLREVKALAYLKHNNIVCYNTAWTEEYDSNISPENGSSSSSQEDSADHHPQDIDLIIYIQMELCASNLQDWLRERNNRVSNSGDNSSLWSSITHSVIQQILIGVAYIHANGLVHRDLKPKNIFLSGDDNDPQVKIGDFGLAKDLLRGDYEGGNLTPTTEGLPDFSNHTKNVGTELYASPEQLGSTEYDFKSDMYSVGIILYEMSNVFTTDMERFIEIGQLRQENKCSEIFQQKSPIEAEIIDALINPVASERPSAEEVLSHQLFMPKDQRQLARLLQTVDQQGQQMMGMRDKLTAAASLVDVQTWTLNAVTQLVRSTENPDLNSRFSEIMSSRSIYDPLSAELMREG